MHKRMDDGLFVQLKQDFDGDALAKLMGLIAFQNMSSKFNNAREISIQGFCAAPR